MVLQGLNKSITIKLWDYCRERLITCIQRNILAALSHYYRDDGAEISIINDLPAHKIVP
jgi:hypothetical protein